MKSLKYSDVCLIPQYGVCRSRSECKTSVVIGGVEFRLPVVPANMKSVVNRGLCKWLSENQFFYSMHRFDIDIQRFIEDCNRENWKTISASIGTKPSHKNIISNIRSSGARIDFLTIDIAHGYSLNMKEMLEYTRKCLPETCIIAGNVSCSEGVRALYKWGADYVKVGIGQGSPCTTKDKTGFTMPMFSCVKACSGISESRNGDFLDPTKTIPIIADGGITCVGDVAKALCAGADFCMAGGIFAACVDSASPTVEIDGATYKGYFGSASYENKQAMTRIEGKLNRLTSNGMTLAQKLQEISEDLQSSISYAGGVEVSALREVQYYELK